MSASEYVVLKKAEGGWNVVKKVTAGSARAAIHAAVEGSSNGEAEGEYIAVPSRSFQSVTVKVESTLKLR